MLCCCLVLLSSNFLVVNAESLDTSKYQVLTYAWVNTDVNVAQGYMAQYVGLSDGVDDKFQKVAYIDYLDQIILCSGFQVSNKDKSAVVPGGKQVEVKLDQLWSTFNFKKPSFNYDLDFIPTENSNTYVVISYIDGSTENIYPVPIKRQDNTIDVSFNFTPKMDVLNISFIMETTVDGEHFYAIGDWQDAGYYRTLATIDFGEKQDGTMNLTIEVQSKESGLLASLIEWVKGIFNNVKDGFDAVKNGISNIANYIIELPNKLWNLISEGLKSLFVPTEQQIVDFKEDIDLLLKEKFGALYEVADIVRSSWENVTVTSVAGPGGGSSGGGTIVTGGESINLPTVTIPLPDGNQFSFGGTTIRCVPQGFEFLATALKTIIGILITFVFANGIRKRYDEVIR